MQAHKHLVLVRLPLLCRVYAGTWKGTQVAVKILLHTALDACNQEAMNQALTLSNPVLANLSKVG